MVNGYPKSGKTEFGRYVGKELCRYGVNFGHFSSIDPVKEVLQPITKWGSGVKTGIVKLLELKKSVIGDREWDGVTKDEYWRWAMSELKAKIIEQDSDLINNIIWNEINGKLEPPYVAFVDIREPENISQFRDYIRKKDKHINFGTIFVESDMSIRSENKSDMSVERWEYNVWIENNRNLYANESASLFFLKARANAFVEQDILQARKIERI